jgi:cyclophilin family peptidyl-prolyl cis-trans isomerase
LKYNYPKFEEEKMSSNKFAYYVLAIALVLPFAAKTVSAEEAAATDEIAVMKTDKGTIKIEFFSDKAPKHVINFKHLAKSGFYDGVYFHRVIPGFMVQGGDPNTKDDDRSNDGMGGAGYHINAEFNDTVHKRGIVSMARSRDPNSASSQFFIMVADAPHLDGQYSAFGRVIKGMDVVDKIVSVKKDRADNPLQKIVIKSIKIVKK